MDERGLRRSTALGDPAILRGRGRGLKLLLDTHALIWAGEGCLGDDARVAIGEHADAVLVSSATIWEIEIKRAQGRLRVPDDVVAMIEQAGFERLPIGFEHALAAGRLPLLHRDPFDRMLVAQARVEGLTLATADAMLARYDVPVLEVRRG